MIIEKTSENQNLKLKLSDLESELEHIKQSKNLIAKKRITSVRSEKDSLEKKNHLLEVKIVELEK